MQPFWILRIETKLVEVFFKKGLFKNFAKFLEKHLCKSLFFNKVAGLMPMILMPIKTYEETREKADEWL